LELLCRQSRGNGIANQETGGEIAMPKPTSGKKLTRKQLEMVLAKNYLESQKEISRIRKGVRKLIDSMSVHLGHKPKYTEKELIEKLEKLIGEDV